MIKALPIRKTLALIAVATVLVSCYFLTRRLYEVARVVVQDHEISDLQDEGDLRCWEMIDAGNQARRQLYLWMRDGKGRADFQSELAKIRTSKGPDSEEGITWRDYVISIRSYSIDGAKEASLYESPSVSVFPNPSAGLFKLARANPYPQMGEVIAIDARAGVLPSQPAPDSTAGLRQRIPAIWILFRYVPPVTAAPAPKALLEETSPVLAMCIALKRGQSPRHLQFLFDQKGGHLMHPQLEGKEEKAIYRGLDLGRESLRDPKRWETIPGQRLAQTQRPGEAPLRVELQQPYFFLEGTLANGPAFRTEKLRWLKWNDATRLQLERTGVSFSGAEEGAPTMRLLAGDSPSLAAARSQVEKEYRAAVPGARIKWKEPVELRHGNLQFLRFYLQTGYQSRSEDAPYFFIYAAFEEELASAIGHELRNMWWWMGGLAALAGALAYGAAYWLFWPLTKIALAAKSVTENSAQTIEREQIEKVRAALPIERQDESGSIARALSELLRRVGNAYGQLDQMNQDLDNRVREKTSQLTDALHEVKKGELEKDAFIANVSHELRQPLNSIFGFLHFLEESQVTPAQAADLAKLRASAVYLKALIDDILDYQSIIMGGMKLEPEEFCVQTFLEEICDAMTPQVQERKNRLERRGLAGLGNLRQDRGRLKQVLINLLSNAAKFTEKGVITLAAHSEVDAQGARWLALEVSDTGRGIKEEELAALFVRFKKLSAREGNKSGTGLGLVLSKGLVELMGGQMRCQSQFGVGSTFSVRLPAGSGELEALRPTVPAEARAADGASSPTILVIDDDPAVCELMERFLRSKGYEVLVAGNGETGLALASEHQPAAITLDIILAGGQTGWDVLGLLKASPRTSGIPVIIMTFLKDAQHGYALGAADYLVKPIAWDRLLDSLKRIIGPAPGVAPVMIVEDDIDMREIMRRMLTQGGLNVVEAGDGVAALEHLERLTPSLILLDLGMPRMDGYGFISEFNRHPEWRTIPIVIITAREPTREERERLTGTVRAILEKDGASHEQLLSTVLAMLKQHAPTKLL